MCILCVIQKWSRRVATMLPWLVIPLIGLWALSQLLPPAFRFEITSPRLACVFVLLVTLFWYEVLMPQLSAWRERRNARLRERRRLEAIELEKLKKTATRRCRNCSTPYRDQNPGGGRFMCSYCGHISKRPVLDMPLPPGLGLSGSGILKDLVGRGGKMLNGKGWTENVWTHGQEWPEIGTWASGANSARSSYWQDNRGGAFGDDENCLVEKSYSGGVLFACRLLTSFFLSIRWLWRKVFRFSSSGDESSSDADQRRLLAKRGEHGTNYNESRGEKARRKAEEKRQARLEKELLEEEERKQREEVARLVEERRKLRDEKIVAERCSKSSLTAKDKESKKEADKKRQERRREKDKASSKSNSDAEELDKRTGKETEWKRELDKNDRLEHQRHVSENFRGHHLEKRHGHGIESNTTSNHSRTSTGGRYFDRMKGTILSSSRAFTDSRFFGKGVNTSTIAKENKVISSADHSHTSIHTRDINPSHLVGVKSVTNGVERNASHPVVSEPQASGGPRKSWHQLFSRSSSVPVSSNVSVISRPSTKPQAAVQSSHVPGQVSPIRTFDNPISFGLPSPFTMPTYSSGSTTSSLGFPPATEIGLPQSGEETREEPELFEDPCYVPDPISLLGPVSESLDLTSEFETGVGLEKQHALKKTTCSEVNKPSPIESPLSRSRIADEKQSDDGIWQMWKSSLGQDSLGFVGGPAGWLITPESSSRSNKEDIMHCVPQSRTTSLFAKEDPSAYPHMDRLGNDQRSGAFSPVAGLSKHDPWSQKAFFPALSGTVSPQEGVHKDGTAYGSPTGSMPDHPLEHPSANHWLNCCPEDARHV
ncbi:PREDICTED: stress response protein nst1 isoform X2 [Tarenaya hassleriana]|uniref:stress response protein nst1 isoform X2 n=1 Tax=Tarenaya hassleriana TaxID=28532 RepID=UPI00053C99AC|nr:PREDICTED: stress response protein nst1 isoform X2 [Tarenaya hassleriana]